MSLSILSMVSILLIMLIKAMGSYLLMLILLEVVMFLGFAGYMSYGENGLENFPLIFPLCYLVMMIFEGVYGLCLMVSLLREEGGDFYSFW